MSNPAFGLSDSDLANYQGRQITYDELLAQYRDLRGHHQAAVRAHDKRDRSAIMRMAGNIASGFVANPTLRITDDAGVYSVADAYAQNVIATLAVNIARAILAEVDRAR